jgi:uncharacterized Ntn-hydrolase superfamily protein
VRKLIAGVFPLAAMSLCLGASAEMTPVPLVHTYSIVAWDAASGQLGVAVQSHFFAAGTVVPWAEAGVGAIAVQSFPDSRYSKLGLELMRAGKSAPEALKSLLATDEARETRQVAMVDARGGVSAHTGSRNIPAAGHLLGANFSVQANLMANDGVWPAMARAFESATGELAERLLAALDAAQQAGGDIRGKQSAAMVVVTGKPLAMHRGTVWSTCASMTTWIRSRSYGDC